MKKIILFYFSGTGNTYWVSKMFLDLFGIQFPDVNVEIRNISDFNRSQQDQGVFWRELSKYISEFSVEEPPEGSGQNMPDNLSCDNIILGLASPIYGANLPKIVRDFLSILLVKKEEILPHAQISCFSLFTMGYVNAYGPLRLKKRLKKNNMDLKWSCNFRVANNIPIGAGKPTSELRKKIKIREPKLKSKMKRMINKIMAGSKYIKGIGPWLLGGYIVKPLLKNSIKSQYKEFFVNMDLCTKCMFCVTSCPTGAIEFENGKPKGEADTTGEKEVKFSFHGECTACMRCYNFCPAFAITFGKRSSDPDQNPRYLGPTLAIEKKIKTGQI